MSHLARLNSFQSEHASTPWSIRKVIEALRYFMKSFQIRLDFDTYRLSSRQVCEETVEETIGLSP